MKLIRNLWVVHVNFILKFKALKATNEEKVLNFSYKRAWVKNNNIEPDTIVKITVY